MSGFLEQINSPDDLKKLSVDELKVLADELRQFILDSVSKTGGHLASSLGVVELTLALHYVFDFKTDKLLWDVGHQCYAHKIITGRKDKFVCLRQADGLSGFPSPAESIYDQFTVGHAGTSIATAIGMALGSSLVARHSAIRHPVEGHESRVTSHEPRIVALVGDASVVNGVSFEALNNLGLVKRQLLIVLNDNSMAIDATEGAVAKYFSKVRLSQTYEDLRKTTSNILEHLPVVGKGAEEIIERIKKSIRMVLPASQLFESLNVPYFGPVNGHDIAALVQLFSAMAYLNHPTILHVYTEKGKGFSPAERDLPKFHSTGPFSPSLVARDPSLGTRGTCRDGARARRAGHETRRTFTSVFGEHLTKLAQKDKKIIAITSAMCDGTGLGEFREKFGDRFYDVGIAESAAVDIAAGLAKSGLKPVVCIYSTFLQRSFDQIFQEVALQNLPVVFCIDRAGLVGANGPTHHGLMDIGYLRMMPNMVLAAPANEIEMKLALEFALGENKPVCLRYPKDLVPPRKFLRSACAKPFKLGKSVVVKKSKGSAIAIVSYGSVLAEALEAARLLTKDGIAVDVINARFAAPIDEKIISLVGQGKSIVTIEDHRLACGFGSALLEAAAAWLPRGITKPITTLAIPKEFVKHDSRRAQLMQARVNADKIRETVRQMTDDR